MVLTRTRPIRRTVVMHGMLLLCVLAGMPLAILLDGPRERTAAPTLPTATAPLLVLHPRQVPIAGTLSGGLRLVGALSPGYPGPNVVCLGLDGRPHGRLAGARIRLVAMMPGMAMAPASAALRPQGRGYCGVLALPMFGAYRVRAVVETLARHEGGRLTIVLTLPGPEAAGQHPDTR